jgi:hypothetical protein
MENIFNDTFNKYALTKDKFESLYIFIIYNKSKEDVEGRLNKIIKIIDSISDSKKKHYLKSRLLNFKNYFESVEGINVNGIFFVGDQIEYFVLDKYYIETLKMFKIDFSYQYGNRYDLDWLKNIIIDRDYTFVIKIKNNDVSISKINEFKQLNIFSDTIKSLSINDLINSKIEKDKKFIIHGSSNYLKNIELNNKACIGIYNKELLLDQQLEIIDEAKYKINIKELEDWLSKILDEKEGHKLVFGNDIEEQTENGLIKTVFCTIDKKYRFANLDNIEIKLVKSFKNNDFISDFIKNYDSVLGIKYY